MPCARLLLWEIFRLRGVVMVLYRQVCRLSYYRPDKPPIDLDEETEAVINGEPVIIENAQPSQDNYKYGRKGRWPHMSAEAEAELSAKMEAEAKETLAEREFRGKLDRRQILGAQLRTAPCQNAIAAAQDLMWGDRIYVGFSTLQRQ